MSSTDIHPPFEAYKGNDPYIFVSYAHKDSEIVFPELQELKQNGYRVWYDEGIDPGNEWPEEVAKALSKASMFLVFISNNAVASQNVRNEINFAINNRKSFLAVYLFQSELPIGLQLRMGDIQAIMKYRMNFEYYRRKLEKSLPESLRIQQENIFDVFISFNRNDILLANQVFVYLSKECGKHVFFSDVTQDYKQIDQALASARAFVVVSSSLENLNELSVKYEWRAFYNDLLDGKKPANTPFIAFITGIDPHDLPRPFWERQNVQADLSQLDSSLQKLKEYIRLPT